MSLRSEDIRKLYETEEDYYDGESDSDLANLSMEELLARIPIRKKKSPKERMRKKRTSGGKILFRQGTHIIKDEEDFQQKIVIPKLKSEGHVIKMVSSIRLRGFLRPAIDVLSILDGKNYFTEIKVKATMNTLQKAIGQLVVHQLLQECDSKIFPGEDIYQIAFPSFYEKESIFSSLLCRCLLERNQIRIVFF